MGQCPVWGWGQRERKHPAQEGRGHAWRPWHGEAVNPFEIVAGAVSFALGTGSAVAWDAGEGWVTDAEPGVLLLLPAPRPRQEGSRGVGSSHQVEGGMCVCVLALLPGRVLGFKGASYPVLKVLPAFVGCLHPTRFPSGVSVGDKATGARHRLVSSTRVSWARVGVFCNSSAAMALMQQSCIVLQACLTAGELAWLRENWVLLLVHSS